MIFQKYLTFGVLQVVNGEEHPKPQILYRISDILLLRERLIIPVSLCVDAPTTSAC